MLVHCHMYVHSAKAGWSSSSCNSDWTNRETTEKMKQNDTLVLTYIISVTVCLFINEFVDMFIHTFTVTFGFCLLLPDCVCVLIVLYDGFIWLKGTFLLVTVCVSRTTERNRCKSWHYAPPVSLSSFSVCSRTFAGKRSM